MLNPMVRWEPGTPAHYRGSHTDLHDTYRAYPCGCHRCHDQHGAVRFRLVDGQGHTVLTCVRARSLTTT